MNRRGGRPRLMSYRHPRPPLSPHKIYTRSIASSFEAESDKKYVKFVYTLYRMRPNDEYFDIITNDFLSGTHMSSK